MSSSSSSSSLSSLSSSSSNNRKPKVTLIGSGGLLGQATLDAFLNSEYSGYFQKPIRVITRNAHAHRVPEPGVTHIRVNWEADNIVSHLSALLRGVHVVVNLLGYNHNAWEAVTEAVINAQPHIYIPPEFSFNHTMWDPRRIPTPSVITSKQRQSILARANGVRTIQIFCGIITEGVFDPSRSPYYGLEQSPSAPPHLTAVMPNNPKTPEPMIAFTSKWDVGRAIAIVCALHTTMPVDQIYIAGEVCGWSKLQKVTGASIEEVGVTAFEKRYLDRNSDLETFIRVAAAEDLLNFSTRNRLNDNILVDPRKDYRWRRLSTVRDYQYGVGSSSQQLDTSSPEDSSKTSSKRKRDNSDSDADAPGDDVKPSKNLKTSQPNSDDIELEGIRDPPESEAEHSAPGTGSGGHESDTNNETPAAPSMPNTRTRGRLRDSIRAATAATVASKPSKSRKVKEIRSKSLSAMTTRQASTNPTTLVSEAGPAAAAAAAAKPKLEKRVTRSMAKLRKTRSTAPLLNATSEGLQETGIAPASTPVVAAASSRRKSKQRKLG